MLKEGNVLDVKRRDGLKPLPFRLILCSLLFDLAPTSRTSGVYNLMIHGEGYGKQESRCAESAVHERIQD